MCYYLIGCVVDMVYSCLWPNKGCLRDLMQVVPCPPSGLYRDEFYRHAKSVDITDEDFKVIFQKCSSTSREDTTGTDTKSAHSSAIVFGVLVPLAFIGVILCMCKKGKFKSCITRCKVSPAKDVEIDDNATMLSEKNSFSCESEGKNINKSKDERDTDLNSSYANYQTEECDKKKYKRSEKASEKEIQLKKRRLSWTGLKEKVIETHVKSNTL